MSLFARLRRCLTCAALPHITPFRGCTDCPALMPSLARRRPTALQPDFPVDVVYTWVDGADPALAAKRAAYAAPGEADAALRQGDCLFRDNQELRYSLRSLHLYAPWVRRVFIVTDGQRPGWLTKGHPGVRVVDHTEIIPAEYLPTFSSRVIEAFLHRIPGLAEHYIYFNDDVFLSAPCDPGDFFSPNGLPYLFTDWRRPRRKSYAKAATPHTRSHANARRYLEEHGKGPAPTLITAHGPFAQTRQNALEAFDFYAEAIRVFAKDRFRSFRGMVFYCHMVPLWAYALRRGVPCDVSYYYIDAKRPDRHFYYRALREARDRDCSPFFFCLNDTGTWPERPGWREDMAAFFRERYPQSSPFEAGEGPADQPARAYAPVNTEREDP